MCVCVCVCVSSGKYPGEKSLDHVVVLFLSFWGIIILFSKVAVPTCIPTNGASEFPFLHILSNTCMLCYYLCFESHLDICDLVSCCGLDLHLPDMLSIFSCACWSSLCLLWKMSIQILLCVFNGVICFFDIELRKFFVYFGYLLLIGYIVCKYPLSVDSILFCW